MSLFATQYNKYAFKKANCCNNYNCEIKSQYRFLHYKRDVIMCKHVDSVIEHAVFIKRAKALGGIILPSFSSPNAEDIYKLNESIKKLKERCKYS